MEVPVHFIGATRVCSSLSFPKLRHRPFTVMRPSSTLALFFVLFVAFVKATPTPHGKQSYSRLAFNLSSLLVDEVDCDAEDIAKRAPTEPGIALCF